jgi:hypothetical protein
MNESTFDKILDRAFENCFHFYIMRLQKEVNWISFLRSHGAAVHEYKLVFRSDNDKLLFLLKWFDYDPLSTESTS